MIDWLRRARPDRPFLKAGDRVWTYAAALAGVEAAVASRPVEVRPTLTPGSVFEILAGIAGAGVVLLGPADKTAGEPSAGGGPSAGAGPSAGPSAGAGGACEGAALVVLTSGTSGVPRGVRLTLHNLEAACRASAAHLGHDETDTWLLALPLSHVGGASILVRSAFTGGSVRMAARFDPPGFARALRGDATMASATPAMLRRVLDHDPGPYDGLRAVLVGGGPVPEGLLEEAWSAGIPALPTYGMTETFGQAATLRPGAPLGRRAHPLPGVELRIEADGRIAVKGEQVSPGYLGEPDRPDPWLTTNDLGEIDDDGAVKVLGRADAVIVTGGENVDPERVESEIITLPGVSDVVVTGVPDEMWGEVVVAVYAGEASADDLRRALGRLPRHMIPTRWLTVGAVPRTPLGKPDRRAAKALAASLGSDEGPPPA